MVSHEEWAALREDVGYIKAKIEVVPDHEERIRSLERKFWGVSAAISAIAAFFGFSL